MVTKAEKAIKQLMIEAKPAPIDTIIIPNLSGVKQEMKAGTKQDHDSNGNIPELVNVCYGTGDPPTASTTPIGTIFIKYEA